MIDVQVATSQAPLAARPAPIPAPRLAPLTVISNPNCFGVDARVFYGTNVRFGSKADICSALVHVRYGPLADIRYYSITSLPRVEFPDPATNGLV